MTDRTCSVDDCERPAKKRVLCNMHYLRLIRHGSTDDPRRRTLDGLCEVEGCTRPTDSTTRLCRVHYWRLKTHGATDLPGGNPPWGSKWCRKCREYKPLVQFYVGKKGPESPCKSCRSTRDAAYRKANPPRTRSDKNRRRRALERSAKSEKYTAVEIADRDGWRCQICGERIRRNLSFPHRRSLSVDHIVPLASGGDDVRANVQAAHFACNAGKRTGGVDQLRLIG